MIGINYGGSPNRWAFLFSVTVRDSAVTVAFYCTVTPTTRATLGFAVIGDSVTVVSNRVDMSNR